MLFMWELQVRGASHTHAGQGSCPGLAHIRATVVWMLSRYVRLQGLNCVCSGMRVPTAADADDDERHVCI